MNPVHNRIPLSEEYDLLPWEKNLLKKYWKKRSSLLSHSCERGDSHLCANEMVGHENSYNVVNMIFKFLLNFVRSTYRISIALKLSVDDIWSLAYENSRDTANENICQCHSEWGKGNFFSRQVQCDILLHFHDKS